MSDHDPGEGSADGDDRPAADPDRTAAEDDWPAADPDRTAADGDRPGGEQPTVTIGAKGLIPGEEEAGQSTTAGVENAVEAADDSFGWHGWLLVGVLVVCLLALPLVVTLRPVRVIGFRATYLLLPLVPAFLLGATAVWVAVRSRQGDG